MQPNASRADGMGFVTFNRLDSLKKQQFTWK
jgi:hypothetical protein